MQISKALIESMAVEQTIEAVTEADELRYSNSFCDGFELDWFIEDDKTEVSNNRSKTEKAKQRKKVDLTK